MGGRFQASDLFKQHPATLVMVVRRPGCALCRHQAGELSQLSEEFKKRNVGVVGVLHEAQGADQFHPFLKDSQLYFDEKVSSIPHHHNCHNDNITTSEALLRARGSLAAHVDGRTPPVQLLGGLPG